MTGLSVFRLNRFWEGRFWPTLRHQSTACWLKPSHPYPWLKLLSLEMKATWIHVRVDYCPIFVIQSLTFTPAINRSCVFLLLRLQLHSIFEYLIAIVAFPLHTCTFPLEYNMPFWCVKEKDLGADCLSLRIPRSHAENGHGSKGGAGDRQDGLITNEKIDLIVRLSKIFVYFFSDMFKSWKITSFFSGLFEWWILGQATFLVLCGIRSRGAAKRTWTL